MKQCPNLKEDLHLGDWPNRVSFLKLPLDTVARTLLAWSVKFGGCCADYMSNRYAANLKPPWQSVQVREVMRPANQPPRHALYEWGVAFRGRRKHEQQRKV